MEPFNALANTSEGPIPFRRICFMPDYIDTIDLCLAGKAKSADLLKLADLADATFHDIDVESLFRISAAVHENIIYNTNRDDIIRSIGRIRAYIPDSVLQMRQRHGIYYMTMCWLAKRVFEIPFDWRHLIGTCPRNLAIQAYNDGLSLRAPNSEFIFAFYMRVARVVQSDPKMYIGASSRTSLDTQSCVLLLTRSSKKTTKLNLFMAQAALLWRSIRTYLEMLEQDYFIIPREHDDNFTKQKKRRTDALIYTEPELWQECIAWHAERGLILDSISETTAVQTNLDIYLRSYLSACILIGNNKLNVTYGFELEPK